jgi:alanine racemase
MVPVALALQESRIPELRLGVFTAAEGFALRDAGVTLPILVFGPVAHEELAAAANARLQLGLLDKGDCEPFSRAGIAAHFKVETGTNRFGIRRESAVAVLQRCAELGVNVAGVYSHLANAEDIDKAFVMQQVDALKSIAASASGLGAKAGKPIVHIAASAAAIMWPQARLDMVRCGIALYGAWPSPSVEAVMAGEDPSFILRPVLRWFAPIVQVRDAPAGESVGYGRSFVTQRPTRIALLPVGYDDGLPRNAGNGRLSVRIGEARAPIVGRIAMNVCALDVTDIEPAPKLGDPVEIEIEPLAKAAGTINYEILARLPVHLERRYQ